MRNKLLALAALLVLAVAAAPADAGIGPTLVKVVGGPEAQFFPFANGSYLVWTQNSDARPDRYHAYGALPDGSGRFKLNAAGTQGYSGSFDPDSNVVIYQQIEDGRSNLWTYDLDLRSRDKLPQPVNSLKWEWAPRISDGYILFQRDARGGSTLYLHERGTDSLIQLHTIDYDRAFMVAGMVGERYATWTVCAQRCAAFLYEIDAADKTKLPVPTGRHQYAPAVDEDRGNVYFVRSGSACGANVGIWRRAVDLSDAAVKLVDLPDDIDTGWTLGLEEDVANNRLDAWFEYFRCRGRQGDIFEARGLATLT